MLKSIDNKVKQGFSKSAPTYDINTAFHREIADKLQAQIKNGFPFSVILDVGCGTGYLAGMLKNKFPQSKITGLDFAPGMIEVAGSDRKDISWVLGDYNDLPFADGSFDTVVSNLAYQWAGDLSCSLTEARRVLMSRGILACTLFGYNTCRELFQSLDEAQGGILQISRLPKEIQVREALVRSGFIDPIISIEQNIIEFKDMHELIIWLKSIGANNLARDSYLGRKTMSRAASIYQEKFPYREGVAATFEVISVYAKK